MNIQFTLCGQICDHINLPNFIKCGSKKTQTNKDVEQIIADINILLNDSKFDRHYICTHILNKLVQITNSEYGFLGKIVEEKDGQQSLYTYAVTNIAWNAASQQFFVDHINNALKFENMNTLFGEVITTRKYKITNKYNQEERHILPDGHPMIKRFMGVPCVIGKKPIIMLGVCNKLSKYTKKDVDNVSTILNILSYLFLDFSLEPKNIMSCPFKIEGSLKEDKP